MESYFFLEAFLLQNEPEYTKSDVAPQHLQKIMRVVFWVNAPDIDGVSNAVIH